MIPFVSNYTQKRRKRIDTRASISITEPERFETLQKHKYRTKQQELVLCMNVCRLVNSDPRHIYHQPELQQQEYQNASYKPLLSPPLITPGKELEVERWREVICVVLQSRRFSCLSAWGQLFQPPCPPQGTSRTAAVARRIS